MLSFDLVTALSDEHMALAQLFARHQEALVSRAWARAAHLLEHYRRRLQYHIQLEERYLLPYCLQGSLPGKWPTETYTAEHRRLEELLLKASTRLAVARRRGVTTDTLIELLDAEKTYKRLVKDHYQREEVAMFAVLRESLPDEARTGLVQLLMQRQHTAYVAAVASLRR
ncbi:MAG: hemerythrin domain-containing protein [Gammaproteobacteria bacterium]